MDTIVQAMNWLDGLPWAARLAVFLVPAGLAGGVVGLFYDVWRLERRVKNLEKLLTTQREAVIPVR